MEIDKTQILFVNLLAQVCVQQQQRQQQSECQLLKQITHNWHFFQLLQAGIVRPVASNESRLDAAAAAAVTGNWQTGKLATVGWDESPSSRPDYKTVRGNDLISQIFSPSLGAHKSWRNLNKCQQCL